MKRGTLMKNLFGLAFALVMANGLFAQNPISADFAPIYSDDTQYIDSVTVGATTPYWVLPDSYFHPNFTTNGSLTAGFTWNWAIDLAGPTMNATDNYVEVDWPAVGYFELSVNEEAPSAMGGCSSADSLIHVRVIAEPSVTYSPDASGSIIGANLEVCEGNARLATDVVQAAITTAAGGSPEVQLAYSLLVETVDAGGNSSTVSNTVYDFVAGTQVTGINAATYDLALPAGGFIAIDGGSGKETSVYTYTINGVTDRISRKSDYLANTAGAPDSWTPYDTTAETIVITVNPAPTTGPIFHIPNSWAD